MVGLDKNFFVILFKCYGIDLISDVQWKVYLVDLFSVVLDKCEIVVISGSELFSYCLLEIGKYQLIVSNMIGDYVNFSCCVLGVSGSLVWDYKLVVVVFIQVIFEVYSYVVVYLESVV